MRATRQITDGFFSDTARTLLPSRKSRCVPIIGLLRGLCGLLALAALLSIPSLTPLSSSPSSLPAAVGKLPLYFIENRGQVEAPVAYYLQGLDTTLYFTPHGLTFVFSRKEER